MVFELRIKVGRKLMFSNVGTLEQCMEWIGYWTSLPTCRKYEHTYTLYPKLPSQVLPTLQDPSENMLQD